MVGYTLLMTGCFGDDAANSHVRQAVLKPAPAVLLAVVAAFVLGRDTLEDAAGVHTHMLRLSGKRYNRCVALGLLCGAVGDACLVFDDLFEVGLGAFLVGHLFYICAFLGDSHGPRLLVMLPLYVLGAGMDAYLWRDVPNNTKAPLVIYTVAIASMGGRGLARVGGRALPYSEWTAALGSAIFLVSDALLAINRFKEDIPHSSVYIMFTYWVAQVLICLSCHGADPDPLVTKHRHKQLRKSRSPHILW